MKLRLLALATSLAFASGAHALTPAEIESARTAGSLKEIYMDKLPTEIVDKLFDKLAADFAMFGYTIEDEF